MKDLKEWIKKLKEDSKEKIVLVEGKKDKKVLEDEGVKNILTLTKPFYKVIEEIVDENKKCIVLVDLDKEGKKLYSKLKYYFNKYGVKINDKFREFLFKNTKIRQIE
jgi:5S rRNA maturation endonuclease (ribonuclease M5)